MAAVNIDLTGVSSSYSLDATGGYTTTIDISTGVINPTTLYGEGSDYPYIYVVDSGNNRINAYTMEGIFRFDFGSFGYGDGEFSSPYSIDTDRQYLYVTDAGNCRIQKFTMLGEYVAQSQN